MSDRKKRYGVFFTPPALVNEMLDHIPPELFRDPEKTFCDPTCGNGHFLVAVFQRKMAGGSSPIQALATTYGVDILPDNVLVTRHRLLKEAGLIDDPAAQALVSKRIKLGDALEDETWRDENFETPQEVPPPTSVDVIDENVPHLVEMGYQQFRWRLP